jgi:hypothetical protein
MYVSYVLNTDTNMYASFDKRRTNVYDNSETQDHGKTKVKPAARLESHIYWSRNGADHSCRLDTEILGSKPAYDTGTCVSLSVLAS